MEHLSRHYREDRHSIERIVLVAYTIFCLNVIFTTLRENWEPWVPCLVVIFTGLSIALHIVQYRDYKFRACFTGVMLLVSAVIYAISCNDMLLVIPEGTVSGFRENQKPSAEIAYSFTMKEAPVDYELDPVKTLVNPNATREAKNVYEFLLEQSGKQTLTGVQSSHSHKNDFVDAVAQHTGRHPALAGYDFLFLQFSPTPDNWSWVQNYNDISAPKEQWAANGLVNYMCRRWTPGPHSPCSRPAWSGNGDSRGYPQTRTGYRHG